MNYSSLHNRIAGRAPFSSRWLRVLLAAGLALGIAAAGQGKPKLPRAQTRAIPAAEFARIVNDFSEEGGFFLSDNFVSNETSYLHVVDKLQQMGASGGAYIGVGPEQNFSYIAAIRPQIAFIVDIRRQAMVQQLMYKAIFHLSEDRVQFLSRLFSKPMAREGAPGRSVPLPELLLYLDRIPSAEDAFKENLAAVEKTIEKEFRIPLSEGDRASLAYVYGAFREANLEIQFRFGGRGSWGGFQYGRFPTMREILLQTDLNGGLRNFLARDEDYRFVRDLQRRNRVIPVVGDFAGKKALASVGGYLRRNGYPVAAFYTSNVEQFLFGNGVFEIFVENVRNLPVNERSLFIRAFTGMPIRHPARVPGHRLTTVLQKVAVFLDDYEQNLYPDYWSLLTTHFISGR
ncbi:MAG: hypothetical protein HYX74_00290 [Acidobacteria bacterium]|nr:hypothetical protein [Acidobacteriota bacterium]